MEGGSSRPSSEWLSENVPEDILGLHLRKLFILFNCGIKTCFEPPKTGVHELFTLCSISKYYAGEKLLRGVKNVNSRVN